MRALRQFLDRDSAAKALVVTALSTAAVALASNVAPAGPAPGGAFSAPGHALVAMSLQAGQVERVADMLHLSTRRCLADQGRMLGDLANGAGRESLDRRAADLAADRADNDGFPLAEPLLTGKGLDKESRDRLYSLANVRETCLAWADRSMEMVGERLAKGGPDLDKAREMAARDTAWTDVALKWHDRGMPVQADFVETMDTYGPRP